MDLLDVINSIIQTNTEAQKLTDISIGTVTSADPLEVQISPNMPPLPSEVLLLCESVQEKEYDVKISDSFRALLESHYITVSDEVIGKYKRDPLAVGDKLIMLRVLKGQQFIILSKV